MCFKNQKQTLSENRLTINSIRNELEMLSNMLKYKTAMLMVSKKKSTSAFSNAQLVIAKTKRYNKNIIGDGILVHSREDTLSKFINPISKNCEWVFDGIIY